MKSIGWIMNTDDERLIEQLLRRPEALSEEDQRAAQQLLERDPAAEAYADFLETFYDLLDAEGHRDRRVRVDRFVDEIFGEEADPLVTVRPFQSENDPQPTVLAAATTASTDDRRFAVLSTLASDDEQMLVRVIGDRDAGRGRLYVLADPPLEQAHVIVSFPDLGLELVTDEDGRRTFDLPSEIEPKRWEEARAVVRRPVATRRLSSASSTTIRGQGDVRIECRRKDRTLTASIHGQEAEPVPSLLLVASAEESGTQTLLRLDENEPVRCAVPTDGEVILRLYE